jgi:hypothetical protein
MAMIVASLRLRKGCVAMVKSDTVRINGEALASMLRFLTTRNLGVAAFSVVFVVLLTACATKELRSAREECRATGFSKYPIDNAQIVVTRQRGVQVPTGQTNCVYTPLGASVTSRCTEVMRTEYVSYQDVSTVDRNEGSRDNFVRSCARNLCQAKYGNPECKAAG